MFTMAWRTVSCMRYAMQVASVGLCGVFGSNAGERNSLQPLALLMIPFWQRLEQRSLESAERFLDTVQCISELSKSSPSGRPQHK